MALFRRSLKGGCFARKACSFVGAFRDRRKGTDCELMLLSYGIDREREPRVTEENSAKICERAKDCIRIARLFLYVPF